MNDLIVALQNALQDLSDNHVAIAQSAYMRNQFSFLGIKKPHVQKVAKAIFEKHQLSDETELIECMHTLWRLPEREYQYVAIDLLLYYKRLWSADLLTHIKQLILTKSWWDTVDTLAPHIVGRLLERYPLLITDVDLWITNDNMWLRRSALIYQLRAKHATDTARLFRNILCVAHEKEFFIRKAIGWSLREYAKTDPMAVKQFVWQHETLLSTLSKKEALRRIT